MFQQFPDRHFYLDVIQPEGRPIDATNVHYFNEDQIIFAECWSENGIST